MRGFNTLKKEGKLNTITVVKNDVSNTPLKCNSSNSSSLVFGAGNSVSELVLRQFLVEKTLGLDFNKALLIALGRSGRELRHPLPPEWREVLEKHNFKANTLRNRLLWQNFLIRYFLLGLITICMNFVESLRDVSKPRVDPKDNYAYFHALSANNFPVDSDGGRVSHDIITWYHQWKGRPKAVKRICHGVKGVQQTKMEDVELVSVSSPIPPLKSAMQFGAYLFWGTLVVGIAFLDMFRFRYWHAVLLRESAKAGQLRLIKPEHLASDYLFHNSNHIYRPLWTYDAEQIGSRILFYFYSTNIETFKTSKGYVLQENIWNLLSWENYLVWDKHQADFINRSTGGKGNVMIVGSIWFTTSDKELPSIGMDKTIAVFDIQPMRDSFYQILGQSNGFNTPNTTNPFLSDIAAVAEKHEIGILFKRKRHIGNLVNKRYAIFVERLIQREGFLSVEPDIDAIRLIEQCNAVVSMAFTSTALLARELGKPAIYYDPNGQLQKDDRAAHGIKIVTGIRELEEWIGSI